MTIVTTIVMKIVFLNEVPAMKQQRFSASALLLILAATISLVDAAVIQVDADCSLRDAIRSANSDSSIGGCTAGFEEDLILIQPGVETLVTPAPSLELPDIVTPMTIQGASTRARIFTGYSTERIFEIRAFDVTLRNLLIEEISDCSSGSAGHGAVEIRADSALVEDVIFRNIRNCEGPGALYASTGSTLVRESVFDNNAAISSTGRAGLNIRADAVMTVVTSQFINTGRCDECSDIYALGELIVQESTFKPGAGSGIHEPIRRPASSQPVTIENSTFSDLAYRSARLNIDGPAELRHVTLAGVDLIVGDGQLSLFNTIVDGDCSLPGTTLTAGGNWYTRDTCLEPITTGNLFLQLLDDRGGATPTHGLHWLSDAIDAGDSSECTSRDQRGVFRLPDCDIGAYERSDSVDISATVDLLTPPPYYEDQLLLFEISLVNLGPDIANVVRLNLIPFRLDVESVESVDAICDSAGCDVDFLLPFGSTRSIIVEASPEPSTSSEFQLGVAAVIPAEATWGDLNGDNNVAEAGGLLSAAADLSIDKTLLTSGPYSIGQALSYNIEIVNNGPDEATNVVFEELPTGLDVSGITNCTGPAQGPCSFPALSPGQTETLTVTAEITDALFDNVGTVGSDQFDPDSQNSIDDQGNGGSTQIEADVQVALDLRTPAPHYFGQIVEYDVRVANRGPGKATAVEVLLDAPGLLLLGVSGPCSFVPCDLGTIEVKTVETVNVLGQILTEEAIPITASVSAQETDPMPSNNSDHEVLPSQAAADIEVSLSPVSQPPFAQGVAVEYELGVINLGFSPASTLTIGVTSQNLDIQQVIGARCTGLPCTIPNFGLHSEIIEILAVPIAAGPFDLSASATASEFDPEPVDNIDDTGNGGIAGIDPSEILFKDSFEPLFRMRPD